MKPKQGLVKQAGKALKKASPTILSILGVVGVVTTAVLAVKATPKALERIADAKEAKNLENGKDLTRIETVTACRKCTSLLPPLESPQSGALWGQMS